MLEPELLSGSLASAGRVFVGYSGGMDSTVLLSLAVRFCRSRGRAAPIALHVDHGLHATSGEWRTHCLRTCDQWGLELRSRSLRLQPGASEALARQARYAYFGRQLEREDDVLLLAHHQDDQVETALLRLRQGRGVYAMPTRRTLGRGMLERPLLEQPKDNLWRSARERGLSWVEDPSNAEVHYLRNHVRHCTLPLLRALDGDWPGRILRLAQASGRLMARTGRTLHRHGRRRLAVRLLAGQEPVMTLRAWLVTQGESRVTDKALAEFCRQLRTAPHAQGSLVLTAGQVRYYRNHVYYVRSVGEVAAAGAQRMSNQEYAGAAGYIQRSYLLPRRNGRYRLPFGELWIAVPQGRSDTLGRSDRTSSGSLAVGFYAPIAKKRWQQVGVPSWLRERYPRVRVAGRWELPEPVWDDYSQGESQQPPPRSEQQPNQQPAPEGSSPRFRWSPD